MRGLAPTLALALTLAQTGCVIDELEPGGFLFACEEGDSCPTGHHCDVGLGECVRA